MPASMTTREVVQCHENKFQASMGSGSSGIRGSQRCRVSLRTYTRVLHYMIMGQLSRLAISYPTIVSTAAIPSPTDSLDSDRRSRQGAEQLGLHRGTSAAKKTPRARLDNIEKGHSLYLSKMAWHACS